MGPFWNDRICNGCGESGSLGSDNIRKPADWPLNFRLLFVIGLYLAVALAALLPAAAPSATEGADKLLHALVFGGMTIATFVAFGHPVISGLIVLGFSTLIEVAQLIVPDRNGSLGDIGANLVGIAIAVLAVMVAKQARLMAKRARSICRK